jgi:hypothetical protein
MGILMYKMRREQLADSHSQASQFASIGRDIPVENGHQLRTVFSDPRMFFK